MKPDRNERKIQEFLDGRMSEEERSAFERRIEIDDLEYRMIRESEQIKLPELNETLHRLLTDIGISICDAIRDQPWDGYITQIDDDRYVIPSGTEVGLAPGDILEVYDSSRIMEGDGGRKGPSSCVAGRRECPR